MSNLARTLFSEYIQRLKNELEKCLINNFSKRNRIDKLARELEHCQENITALKSEQAQTEKEKRDLELKNALLIQQTASGSRAGDVEEKRSQGSMQAETDKMKSELENIIKVIIPFKFLDQLLEEISFRKCAPNNIALFKSLYIIILI